MGTESHGQQPGCLLKELAERHCFLVPVMKSEGWEGPRDPGRLSHQRGKGITALWVVRWGDCGAEGSIEFGWGHNPRGSGLSLHLTLIVPSPFPRPGHDNAHCRP